MPQEEWRPVVGSEGCYEVSSHGRVRSLDRMTVRSDGVKRHLKGRLLTSNANSHGYVTVRVPNLRFVHRLVAESFIPNPDNHPNVLHWDDVSTNNHVENLRWGSQRDNILDILRNGNHRQANRTRCPKGHEYSEENTRVYTTKQGWKSRRCAKCDSERYYARKNPSTSGGDN